ncbi:hypothetical protein ACGFX4_32730 [Kitasatospora sp. NPDC048365]|uniref:hypothetical protein n=1 Tax=Kitasatospora sp. NPDC048365 TaxID=3364050 RepID=UPI0037111645
MSLRSDQDAAAAVTVQPPSRLAEAVALQDGGRRAGWRGRPWLRRSVVVVVVGAVVAGAGWLWADARPVALGSLGPGDCFSWPSPQYLDKHPEEVDSFGLMVVRTSCVGNHDGEVVDVVALEPARAAEVAEERPGVSTSACGKAFTRANPDYWALPADIGFVPVLPGKEDLADHPNVSCLYLGDFGITGSLRADASRLTDGQRRYLDAVDPYNELSAMALDLKGVSVDRLSAWAGEMAAAEQTMVERLEQLGAPAGAEQAFARVVERHRAAQFDWQQVASARTSAEARRLAEAARDTEHEAMDPALAVRAALGLSTTMRPAGWSL